MDLQNHKKSHLFLFVFFISVTSGRWKKEASGTLTWRGAGRREGTVGEGSDQGSPCSRQGAGAGLASASLKEERGP